MNNAPSRRARSAQTALTLVAAGLLIGLAVSVSATPADKPAATVKSQQLVIPSDLPVREPFRKRGSPSHPERPPLPSAPEGWKRGKVEYYEKDAIYRLIDGAADIYADYGFETAIYGEFSSSECEASVTVFDMGTPLNAFAIYARERNPNASFIRAGEEAYLTDRGLVLFRAYYYIKLAALSKSAGAADCLKRLAYEADKLLPKTSAFSLMPLMNMVKGSERYVLGPIPGIETATASIRAEYLDANGISFFAYMVPCSTEKKCMRLATVIKAEGLDDIAMPKPSEEDTIYKIFKKKLNSGKEVSVFTGKTAIAVFFPSQSRNIESEFVYELLSGDFTF